MQKNWLFFLIFVFISCPLFADSSNASTPFQFSVLDHPTSVTNTQWQNQINQIESSQLSFAVINGLRSNEEPCTDDIYYEKINLLKSSKKPIFFSLAGKDWIGCKNQNGNDIRIERLQRLREILFDTETAFGTDEIPLVRQSHSSRYPDFPENTYWQYGPIFFITLNLPAENNHYLNAAGRNNEFEERLLANERWLKRSFILAKRNNLKGLVIICDGNPFQKTAKRDGFKETRQLIKRSANKFPGKVLIIHSQADLKANAPIIWENNLGRISTNLKGLIISVDTKRTNLFTLVQ